MENIKMTVVVSAAETNWFPVKDPDAFRAFLDPLPVEYRPEPDAPAIFRKDYPDDPCLFQLYTGEHQDWPSELSPSELWQRWQDWMPLPTGVEDGDAFR